MEERMLGSALADRGGSKENECLDVALSDADSSVYSSGPDSMLQYSSDEEGSLADGNDDTSMRAPHGDDHVWTWFTTHNFHNMYQAVLQGLNVVVINDCGNHHRPLISVDLNRITLSLTGIHPLNNAVCSVTGAVHSYNDRQVAWEPVIEQVGLDIQASYVDTDISEVETLRPNGDRRQATSPPEPTVLNVESRGPLNITLSLPFLDTALTTIDAWKRDLSHPSRLQEFAPFYLANYTGVTIEHCWDNEHARRVYSSQIASLQSRAHRRRRSVDITSLIRDTALLPLNPKSPTLAQSSAGLADEVGARSSFSLAALEQDVEASLPPSVYHPVKNNEKCIVDFGGYHQEMARLVEQTSMGTALVLQIRIPGWQPLESVSIRKIGSFVYPLHPAIDGKLEQSSSHDINPGASSSSTPSVPPLLHVDVSLEDGSKVVRLRSGVELRNHLTKAVRVRMSDRQAQSSLDVGIIRGGGRMHVPLSALTMDNVYLQPLSSVEEAKMKLEEESSSLRSSPSPVPFTPSPASSPVLNETNVKTAGPVTGFLWSKPISRSKLGTSARAVGGQLASEENVSVRSQLEHQFSGWESRPPQPLCQGVIHTSSGTILECAAVDDSESGGWRVEEKTEYIHVMCMRVSPPHGRALTYNGTSGSETIHVHPRQDELVLTLYSPVVLRNLFPREMQYRVTHKRNSASSIDPKGDHHVIEGSLKPGALVELLSVSMELAPFLSFQVEGLEWSSEVSLTNNLSSGMTRTNVTLADTGGNEIYASVENVPSGAADAGIGGSADSTLFSSESVAAACVVTVYAQYWLVNRTSLDLVYGTCPGGAHPSTCRPVPAQAGIHRVVEEVYENQRYFPLIGWKGPKLPTDRPDFSDITGKIRRYMKWVNLPNDKWRWTGPWSWKPIDTPLSRGGIPRFDAQGWEYAKDFGAKYHNHNATFDVVRRRRWVRVRICESFGNNDVVMLGIRLIPGYSPNRPMLKTNVSVRVKSPSVEDVEVAEMKDGGGSSLLSPWSESFDPSSHTDGVLSISHTMSHTAGPAPSSDAVPSDVSRLHSLKDHFTPRSSAKYRYDISAHFSPAPGTFGSRVSTITFLPRYVIVNRLKEPVLIAQGRQAPLRAGDAAKDVYTNKANIVCIPSNEHTSFVWREGRITRVSVTLSPFSNSSSGAHGGTVQESELWQWSGPFSIDYVEKSCLTITDVSSSKRKHVRVVTKEENATVYVILSECEPEHPMYRIDNFSGALLHFRQFVNLNDPSSASRHMIAPSFRTLESGRTLPYSWSELSASKPRLVEIRIANHLVQVPFDQLGYHKIVKVTRPVSMSALSSSESRVGGSFVVVPTTPAATSKVPPSSSLSTTKGITSSVSSSGSHETVLVHLFIYARRHTKVLFVGTVDSFPQVARSDIAYIRMLKRGLAQSSSSSDLSSSISSDEADHKNQSPSSAAEETEEKENHEFKLLVHIPFAGISLVDRTPQEVVYMSVDQLRFFHSRSDLFMKVSIFWGRV